MKKFTDGPWEVRGLDGDAPYIVALSGGHKWNDPTICNLYDDVTPSDSVTIGAWNEPMENFKANAALIATAPELLECLQEALSELQAVFTWQIENKRISEVVATQRLSTINKARTAIAKAKGENNA